MRSIPLHEAEGRLAELIEAAAEGEDVQITRGDGAAFRLTPVLGSPGDLDAAYAARAHDEKREAAAEAHPQRRGSLREDIARMQERIGRLPMVERGADEALIGYDDPGPPGLTAVVLDTSALIAVLQREPEAERLVSALEAVTVLYISAATLVEPGS